MTHSPTINHSDRKWATAFFRIMSELKDAHGEWVREHWQPKEIPRHVRRMIEKADFYRRKLTPEAR